MALVASVLALWFTVTSPSPLLPTPAAPTAEQVGAGRDAYHQLRGARGNPAGQLVVLGPAQLDGIGALASHGFRPDRLQLATEGRQLRIAASHHLFGGRWLNVTVRAEGPSASFPRTHLRIGSLSLPPLLSRWTLGVARWLLHLRRTDVPPLDRLVRNFSVHNGMVSAVVSLPGRSGLIDEMASAVAEPIDSGAVARIYCALADRQRKQPSGDFAEQVRRAFSAGRAGASPANYNRAAFIALGMLLVDERVGDFAEPARAETMRCRIAPVAASIYGRYDWPKHWALSAAIAVGAGVQLSEAAGEWKELADSLVRQSRFAIGDPSGFSLSDLTADRAGFLAARAAVAPGDAERLASELTNATPQQLLPSRLVLPEEALPNAEFVRRYGGIDDPRFKARVRAIDAALDSTGLR